MKVNVVVDEKTERVTYSTTLMVDGRNLILSNTQHLGYQSKERLDNPLFEDVFYWPVLAYTNLPTSTGRGLNHLVHTVMVERNYKYTSSNMYEVQYEEF